MYQNSNQKLYAVLFSGIVICFTTPLLFGIIYFERNNHHRTLINQLISSIIWYGILWNGIVQVPRMLRYMLGPFPTWICCIDQHKSGRTQSPTDRRSTMAQRISARKFPGRSLPQQGRSGALCQTAGGRHRRPPARRG